MTKSELNKFKNILEAKQAELEQLVPAPRCASRSRRNPDALDEVQHAAERELAIRNLDRESNLLRNVRAALRRIDEGAFEVCLHCEEDISQKRLAAIPWTAFCIRCQEVADRNQAGDGSRLRRAAGQRSLIQIQTSKGAGRGRRPVTAPFVFVEETLLGTFRPMNEIMRPGFSRSLRYE